MKWFFALNEASYGFDDYAAMIKVAVFTAQNFTRLEPHFLYDGEENDLTRWLRSRNVTIHQCRSFLYDKLENIAEKRQDPNILKIGAGAFLRTEIPRLTAELKFPDKYVLYTDVDVMFLEEVVGGLQKCKPKYFAVAPEHRHKDYLMMNTGVMVMNLRGLRRKDSQFRAFMLKETEWLVDNVWDQGAYRFFYTRKWARRFGLTRWVDEFQWGKLPEEFNWKPYWGENKKAKILHFHGPKPHQESILDSPSPPEQAKPLLPLVNETYHRYCVLWNDCAAEIAAKTPQEK